MTRLGRRTLLTAVAATLSGAARASGDAPRVSVDAPRLALPSGRSALDVVLPTGAYASLGVLGSAEALLGFDLCGSPAADAARRASPLDEDGLLPHFVSFAPLAEGETFHVTVDAIDPVEVVLVVARADESPPPAPKALASGAARARPLVGIPAPRSRRDGYMLQVAARYSFARIDVVEALLSAFGKMRKTFKRDPIGLSDISQWDGQRPKTDRGAPRHISHAGGADVDIGFPAMDEIPSTARDHCKGVLIDPEHFGCAPGSGKGVDFERLVFFLGTLVDETPAGLVKVFMDDVYRREVMRLAPELKKNGLIKDDALVALSEDGIVVASPWHTDHFHVRFGGEKGISPFAAT